VPSGREAAQRIIENPVEVYDELGIDTMPLARHPAVERYELSDTEVGKTSVDGTTLQFQDLTGQIIRRVMKLVKEVEDGLVSLISISAPQRGTEERKAADNKTGEANSGTTLEGPQVPGHESDTAVSGQDEVDDLLSSLGF
jgi:chemotaxis protein CheZ